MSHLNGIGISQCGLQGQNRAVMGGEDGLYSPQYSTLLSEYQNVGKDPIDFTITMDVVCGVPSSNKLSHAASGINWWRSLPGSLNGRSSDRDSITLA